MKKLIGLFLIILLAFGIFASIYDTKPVEEDKEEISQEEIAPAAEDTEEAESKAETTPFVVGKTETSSEIEETPEIQEDKTPVDSLEELNEMLGTHLPHMDTLGGTDESYALVNDDIAEIAFSWNGIPCAARASRNLAENITGSLEGQDGVQEDGAYATYGFYGLDMSFVQFGYDEEQYAFLAYHNGEMDSFDFEIAEREFAETIYAVSLPEELAGISGYYVDSVVKASYTVVTPIGPTHCTFYSAWAISEEEYRFVTGILSYEDGKLTYEELPVYGQEESEIYPSLQAGYLTYRDGALAWDGASEEPFCQAVFTEMGPRDVITQNENGEWVTVDKSEYGL